MSMWMKYLARNVCRLLEDVRLSHNFEQNHYADQELAAYIKGKVDQKTKAVTFPNQLLQQEVQQSYLLVSQDLVQMFYYCKLIFVSKLTEWALAASEVVEFVMKALLDETQMVEG